MLKETHRWREGWELVVGGGRMEGLSKKDKRLMDMDNSVVVAGERVT